MLVGKRQMYHATTALIAPEAPNDGDRLSTCRAAGIFRRGARADHAMQLYISHDEKDRSSNDEALLVSFSSQSGHPIDPPYVHVYIHVYIYTYICMYISYHRLEKIPPAT
jgi:hypothetical protein